jgi:hypothetical protein
MAFRIQDPVTSLFWEVDDGYRIRLGDKGSVYTQDGTTGFIVNVDTGMNINIPGNVLMEGGWPTVWKIEDGVISVDADHIVQYDEGTLSLRVTSTPASWVLIPVGAPAVAPVVEETVAEEPAVEAEPLAEEPVEEDEDVPVARSAALIEEALNAKAADDAAAAEAEPEEEA